MIKFVSFYLVARAVRQHLKPRWAAETSLMKRRIEWKGVTGYGCS